MIERVEELPRDLMDLNPPAVGGYLIHPYNTHIKQWMAHCHNSGCGEYIDDCDDVPARDLLCDRCEEAGVTDEE